ncbi:MAG: dephospho-CoA kinase [Burkholderiaceae bacterium]|nr:dephospho-CoA kinase [Burkholderiaceae bacterium]
MSHTAFKRIGLTGGIGSGKSTLAQLLVARGVDLIDADALSRQLTAAHGAAMPDIEKEFGPTFMAADGSLARERMRQLVFSQPEARLRLQALLHPRILAALTEQEMQLINQGKPLVVLDIPLLVESAHWRQKVDRVLVVDCSQNTQIRRVMQRSGMAAEAVQAIMATQASREQRLAAADWVVANDSDDIGKLRLQAQAIQLHL